MQDRSFKEIAIASRMYEITMRSRSVEKQLHDVLHTRPAIIKKLEKIKQDPRRALEAHKLKGEWEGKWGCYLGWDIRLIYKIDDKNKQIIVFAAGSHKIY